MFFFLFVCSFFLLSPSLPVGCMWGQQPGGAAVQHPRPGTLQQGVEQQQLQWIRDQLGVWLGERKQLQRERRQQALTLLQPRGKGFCSSWFGVVSRYYTHSDFFFQPRWHKEAGGRWKKKKGGRENHKDLRPGTMWNASGKGCWGRFEAFKTKWRRKWPCDIFLKLELLTKLTACLRLYATLLP